MDNYYFHLLPNFFHFIIDHKILFIYLLLYIMQYLPSLNIRFFNFEAHYLYTKMLKFFFITAAIFNNTKIFQCISIVCFLFLYNGTFNLLDARLALSFFALQ